MNNELTNETIYQIYVLTDRKQVFQRRVMNQGQARAKNEAAKIVTDFNIQWLPQTEELARIEPVWS